MHISPGLSQALADLDEEHRRQRYFSKLRQENARREADRAALAGLLSSFAVFAAGLAVLAICVVLS